MPVVNVVEVAVAVIVVVVAEVVVVVVALVDVVDANTQISWETNGSVLLQVLVPPTISRKVSVYQILHTAFSVWTEFTASSGKRANLRDECHWSHACWLQASRRVNQWHPRVEISVEKRTPHH